ncbi:porin family protein [Marivirga harenae]|uniref:porin family protein n=1 Tax=Marivirga harenae TaxID=2010992 RepID=UPI0026E0FB67|nr:porin family protein [Marivirga harenae]WKV12715.1 porin family protein [Marivirga harenae]|tara:strand:+ start:62228 stop:62905 length:678 start_codon:yes stop_codon:yes gene_type:complete
MKNIFKVFILFLCFLLSAELKSQSFIGTKGGVNIPFVNFSDFTNVPITTRIRSEFFVGPTFGLTYRYMQNDKIGVQFDLNYSTKGWGQNTFEFTNTFITRINYLELPFYFHWQMFGTENFKFFLDAGVYVAWALSSSQTITNNQDLSENQITYSIENDNRGDFGLHVGAGVSYNFSSFILQLEGGFQSGFANILPVNHFIRVNPVVSTNQVPSARISLLFPLRKN